VVGWKVGTGICHIVFRTDVLVLITALIDWLRRHKGCPTHGSLVETSRFALCEACRRGDDGRGRGAEEEEKVGEGDEE
jgi:hypothetical protein